MCEGCPANVSGSFSCVLKPIVGQFDFHTGGGGGSQGFDFVHSGPEIVVATSIDQVFESSKAAAAFGANELRLESDLFAEYYPGFVGRQGGHEWVKVEAFARSG